MNFFEFDISYFRFYENIFLGIFHGILFSFPLSTPILISFRYKLASVVAIDHSTLYDNRTQGQIYDTSIAQPIISPTTILPKPIQGFEGFAQRAEVTRPPSAGNAGSAGLQAQYRSKYTSSALFRSSLRSLSNGFMGIISRPDFMALVGTILGQLSFLVCLCLGCRPIVQIWYTLEPFLFLLGTCLILNRSTDFKTILHFGNDWISRLWQRMPFGQKTSRIGLWPFQGNAILSLPAFGGSGSQAWSPKATESVSHVSKWNPPNTSVVFNIFCFQILLAFLNPIASAIPTRIFLGQDLIELFNFSYSLSFFITSFICISLFFQSPSFLYAVTEGINSALTRITSWASRATPYLPRKLVTEILLPITARLWRVGFAQYWAKPSTGALSNDRLRQATNKGNSLGQISLGPTDSYTSSKKWNSQQGDAGDRTPSTKTPLLPSFKSLAQKIDNLVVFFIVGCVIQGSLQYNWRLFVNYPLEFIGSFSSLQFARKLIPSQARPPSAGSQGASEADALLHSEPKATNEANPPGGAPVLGKLGLLGLEGIARGALGAEGEQAHPSNSAGYAEPALMDKALFGGQKAQYPNADGNVIGQYRGHSIDSEPANTSDSSNPPKAGGTGMLLREFPSFDSNIRHRDKNLPVERHLPIERMNARRSLSGKIPFNEEQKSDAYIKYASFFLNSIEKSVENFKFFLQDRIEKVITPGAKTPTKQSSGGANGSLGSPALPALPAEGGFGMLVKIGLPWSRPALMGNALFGGQNKYNELAVLQKIKDEYNSMNTPASEWPTLQLGRRFIGLASGLANDGAEGWDGQGHSSPQVTRPRLRILLTSKNEENITKGKPKNSYIRTLFDDRLVGLQNGNDRVALGPVGPWPSGGEDRGRAQPRSFALAGRYNWNTSFCRFVHDDLYLYCNFLDESRATTGGDKTEHDKTPVS